MMVIKLIIEYKNGKIERENFIEMDDLQKLVKGKGQAGITTTIGFSLEYGAAKASVSVHLACDQDAESMDKAAALSLERAKQYADYAMEAAHAMLKEAP